MFCCAPNKTPVKTSAADASARSRLPRVDISETTQSVVIVADLPGVDAKHLEVTVDRRVLTITGTTTASVPGELSPLHREYDADGFQRSFSLGTDINAEDIRATMRDGVLTLILAKTSAAKPQRITVRAT